VKYEGRGLRILDFDTECRPLSYLGNDYTGEVTAIAWCWIVNGKVKDMECRLLGVDDRRWMFEDFADAYNLADMVTGHYIRGYDLPVLNGQMLDLGLPPLHDKLSHDTKLDLVKRKYISASQENLAAHLGVRAPKVQMNQVKWREANRLTPDGLTLTHKRVTGDVRQHVALRNKLIQLGWLSGPRMWKSSGHLSGAYEP
jgi:hypothetical protein